MAIQIKELSETDGQDIFDMIQEIGLGENSFTTNFPDKDFEEFKRSCLEWFRFQRE
ncbi:hypothetical protein [Paenibacillus ihumii]|uniref:hypothetical protein n=1 Tax=Paenibacillus ihumii TaxID=687436 RepID=UPI001E45E1AE|nr:hypothetical protein [Paenibacillus ihumii]